MTQKQREAFALEWNRVWGPKARISILTSALCLSLMIYAVDHGAEDLPLRFSVEGFTAHMTGGGRWTHAGTADVLRELGRAGMLHIEGDTATMMGVSP